MNPQERQKQRKQAVFVLLPLILGTAAGFLAGSMGADYEALEKPFFSPPGFIFPVVWAILYLFMGVSSYLAYEACKEQGRPVKEVLIPYGVQLALNLGWSFVFFTFRNYMLGFFWILALIAAVLWMINAFSKVSQKAASLQIPYVLWCCFAAVLNFSIWMKN